MIHFPKNPEETIRKPTKYAIVSYAGKSIGRAWVTHRTGRIHSSKGIGKLGKDKRCAHVDGHGILRVGLRDLAHLGICVGKKPNEVCGTAIAKRFVNACL